MNDPSISRRDYLKAALLTATVAGTQALAPAARAADPPAAPVVADPLLSSRDRRMQWWRDARFGMFIHFGIYSIPARGEWVMAIEDIPKEQYARFADEFNPTPGAARAWARTARRAGMRYMVLTTKHHDGFCLFDTALTEYCAVKRGPRRDLVKEYVDAAREEGLRVGFYLSLMDWHHPDGLRSKDDPAARARFVAFVHGQVRELLTQYGKVDVLWYDMMYPLDAVGFDSIGLNKMALELQPDIVINNRNGAPGDFVTPEQTINPQAADWESCMTLNDHWGYHSGDHAWKTPHTVLSNLVQCASFGGNYLVNVGPRPDGSLPPESIDILSKVGAWMDRHGPAIHGTERCHAQYNAIGWTTLRGTTLYWHLQNYLAPVIHMNGVAARVRTAKLQGLDQPLEFQQDGADIAVAGLPAASPEEPFAVVELVFDAVPIQRNLALRIIGDLSRHPKPVKAAT